MGKRKKKTKTVHSCSKCSAICCQYVAIEIDAPTTPGDFEDLRWYIAHKDIWVFKDGDEWYVCIERPCRYLSKNNQCTIYETRPRICRKYNIANCELNGHGKPYDLKFCAPEEIRDYAEKYFREKRAKARARYRRLRVR